MSPQGILTLTAARHRPYDEVSEPESFFGFQPLPHRGPAVSNDLIDQLREDESE